MRSDEPSIQVAYFSRILGLVTLLFCSGLACSQPSQRDSKEVEPSGLEWIQGDVAVSLSGNTLTVIAPVGIDMFTLDPQDSVTVRGMTPNEVYSFLVRKAASDLLKHSITFWNSEAANYTLVLLDEEIARKLGVNPRWEQGSWTVTMREVAVALSLTNSVEDATRSIAYAMQDPELKPYLERFLDGTFANVGRVSRNLIPHSVKKTIKIQGTRHTIGIDAIVGMPEVLGQVCAIAKKEIMDEATYGLRAVE